MENSTYKLSSEMVKLLPYLVFYLRCLRVFSFSLFVYLHDIKHIYMIRLSSKFNLGNKSNKYNGLYLFVYIFVNELIIKYHKIRDSHSACG